MKLSAALTSAAKAGCLMNQPGVNHEDAIPGVPRLRSQTMCLLEIIQAYILDNPKSQARADGTSMMPIFSLTSCVVGVLGIAPLAIKGNADSTFLRCHVLRAV
jgi:hypothetical protein